MINDFPQQARWKITQKSTVNEVYEMTGVAIITKGKQGMRRNIFTHERKGARERTVDIACAGDIAPPCVFSLLASLRYNPEQARRRQYSIVQAPTYARACVLFVHRGLLGCLYSPGRDALRPLGSLFHATLRPVHFSDGICSTFLTCFPFASSLFLC